jgi:hypothetical protein
VYVFGFMLKVCLVVEKKSTLGLGVYLWFLNPGFGFYAKCVLLVTEKRRQIVVL